MWPFRKQSLSAEFYYLYNRLIQMEKRIMSEIKDAADAAVADMADLRAKLVDVSAKLDAALAANNDADVAAAAKELRDAVAIDAPPAPAPEAPAAQ
jgi:hypothetical protein